MRMVDLIEKKRDGYALSKEEIDFMINGFVDGSIPDYQMSAMAMAIYFQDMNDDERANITLATLNSGDKIDLSSIEGIKVDKHSTGGVGDKTTLALAPLVASVGVPVAKMSGRGLGHTGGTLDKLESIPGFDIFMDNKSFIKQVNEKKIAVIGQSANLTPADKLLYALRDVTGTIPSIPLIAQSIMSKKLASGANAIVLDVKTGSGAFMKTFEDSKKLAQAMVNIGNLLGRDTSAVITNMNEPLGYAVGNTIEVIEAIETLKGRGPEDFKQLVLTLGSHMVYHAKKAKTIKEAYTKLEENLNNGKALDKLRDLIVAQKGDPKVLEDYSIMPFASEVIDVLAPKTGYVKDVIALEIGHAAMVLGAGRETKEENVDHGVGIVLNVKVGNYVTKGDLIAKVHTNGKNTDQSIKEILDAIRIVDEKVEANKLILDVIE